MQQAGNHPGDNTDSVRVQRDLAAEHRRQTRSLMALIRAVVRRTAASSTSLGDFVAHLNGRLDAIARVQEIMMRHAAAQVDLLELLADEFLRQGVDTASVKSPTTSLLLDRSVAAGLALALHELTTNAIKFGRLGQADRQIRIDWIAAPDDQITFRWREVPDPENNAPPAGGFGFELIRNTLPYEIGARTHIDLTADGLLCEITFNPRNASC